MNKRKIKDNVFLAGAVDWSRRLFDSLIPLPLRVDSAQRGQPYAVPLYPNWVEKLS